MKPFELVTTIVTQRSHPAGVRGLKHVTKSRVVYWYDVAPRRGAWIETHSGSVRTAASTASHPAGVRGLKLVSAANYDSDISVAPRRGAWIETAH